MQKVICKKTYDTETATLLKKVTHGVYGASDGWEETLYQTESGRLIMIWSNHGEKSYFIAKAYKFQLFFPKFLGKKTFDIFSLVW